MKSYRDRAGDGFSVAAFRVAAAAITGLMLSGGIAFADNAATSQDEWDRLENVDAARFTHPTVISNKFLPMAPGMRWVYEGISIEDDGKPVPHRIEVTVTDLVKTISGITTVVSYDIDYSDGEFVEAELAFYAQDDDGNVWHVGEYPEEYEDGRFIKAPAWMHGFEGARAGIMMKADPRPDTPSYSEGWGPAVGWTDRGVVHQAGQEVSVAAGTFRDVLVIKESARAEADAQQLKYYAPGTGNIRTGWTGGEKTKEMLELVRREQISPATLQEVRSKALELERSAYSRSAGAYAHTQPATVP